MQYKTVSGKKVYSSGITVRNWISSKSADGFELTDFIVDANPNYDLNDVYEALPDYMTEDDLLQEEIYAALDYDPSFELVSKDADFTDDPFLEAAKEYLAVYEGPEEISEEPEVIDWNTCELFSVPPRPTVTPAGSEALAEKSADLPAAGSAGDQSIEFFRLDEPGEIQPPSFSQLP